MPRPGCRARSPTSTRECRGCRRAQAGSRESGMLSRCRSTARLAVNTRDCVATEVRPEQTRASPTTKRSSGSPKAIARAERGIGKRGEKSREERHHKGEPDGIAHQARGLADQSVDAGAEHAAEPVKGELHRSDGSVQRWPLPLFGWMRFRACRKIA